MQSGPYWSAGWLSFDEIRDLSPVCDQLVSPLSNAVLQWQTRYKNILNRAWTRIRGRDRKGWKKRSDGAEQEATLVLNCCMCASFSFTCCDTRPRGAICSRCFISRRNQQGHKDPANKDSRNKLFKESHHVTQRHLYTVFILYMCNDFNLKLSIFSW